MNDNVKKLTENVAVSDIQTLIADPKIQKIYGNGFTFGFSLSDASIVIQHGPVPVALLTLSFTSLKTLSIALNEVISQIERDLGEPIKGIQAIKETISQQIKP